MNKKITSFLIDDDVDDQEIFAFIVQKIGPGIRCEFAKDGIHVLDKIIGSSFTPDIIFLDINMPRMSGPECLAELKKIGRLVDIPIYMFSTSDEQIIVKKCLKLGAAGFIKKRTNTDEMKNDLGKIFANLKLPG